MFGSHGHAGSPCPIPGRGKVIRNFHLLHRPCALILSVKHDYYNYIVRSFLIQGVAFGMKLLAFFEARSGFGAIFLIYSIPFFSFPLSGMRIISFWQISVFSSISRFPKQCRFSLMYMYSYLVFLEVGIWVSAFFTKMILIPALCCCQGC